VAHFYLSDDVGAAEAGDEIALLGEEARHAAQVARLRVGERVVVGDGRGAVAQAEATAVAKDRVVLRVDRIARHPRPEPRIVLVQALAKGGRDELAIQAATELGVAAVVPWQAGRSVTRWVGPKAQAGVTRWGSIVREAGKQAMRPWAVEVLPALSTAELAATARDRRTVVLDPLADLPLTSAVPMGSRDELALVVGPEGGIGEDELSRLVEGGAIRARLGHEVLRTSTAGPAALAALAVHLGLWS
jgi:16S rRNA (uracil1498-N3)-methyltransferase